MEMPEWGCFVAVIGNRLYAAPIPLGPDSSDEPLLPVDFVCRHFLVAVNAALGTDFDPEEFPYVSCAGCERPDDQPEPQLASLP